MKEIERHEPASDMGLSLQSQTQRLLQAHIAQAEAPAPLLLKAAPPVEPWTLAKAFGGLADLVKSQIKGYTKKDGTVVNAFSNKVQKKAAPGGSAPADGGSGVDPEHLDLMASSLANDENSTDKELHEHFTSNGVPEQHSKAAIAQREEFGMANPSGQTAQYLGVSMAEAAKKTAATGAKTPAASVKPPAASASDEQISAMEGSLANDENSSDEELVAHFVDEFKVDEAVAKQAVAHRDAFLSDANPKPGLLAQLMKGKAVAKPAAGNGSRETPGAAPAPADTPDAAPAPAAPAGDVPPQADAQQAGWDKLPDDENPQHALSGMSSKALGSLATAKPEHAKAYAHAALASRGQDSAGKWQGFDKAKALHGPSIPTDHQPQKEVSEVMQSVHGKVLQAAAQGHLDLQDRARAQLSGRGHDVHGNWVGFDKAAKTHGFDGKTGKKAAPGPAGGSGSPKGPSQPDMFKALRPGERPMFFVSADRADELRRLMGLTDQP